jgi:hypothetical protein
MVRHVLREQQEQGFIGCSGRGAGAVWCGQRQMAEMAIMVVINYLQMKVMKRVMNGGNEGSNERTGNTSA